MRIFTGRLREEVAYENQTKGAEGILLPSNMAAKTTLCLYLGKRLVVTLRCVVNVTTSSFQHFP